MKACRISANAQGALAAAPLPLPTTHRKGSVEAGHYRQQASGEIPKVQHVLQPATVIRAITLSDGAVGQLASGPGALLTFVISGELRLGVNAVAPLVLIPGDVLLTDEASAGIVEGSATGACRLVQLDVPSDWPGTDAALQEPGTISPRPAGQQPNFKRMYASADDRSYFSELAELFPPEVDRWGEPRPIRGFRLLCWEDGWMDYHPCVINQLAILLSGEMDMEVGGGNGASETFYTGDICIAEDGRGQGHKDRVRGVAHIAMVAIDTEHLWKAADVSPCDVMAHG